MATKFIKYEKALLKIADQSIMAESAELGVEASLQPITNVTGSVIRYAPSSPVKGTLSFSHYCTGAFHDFLNPLTAIEHTGEPLDGSLAGMTFSSGYIKSLSFSVSPFTPILFQSQMDIYGELNSIDDNGDSDNLLRNERNVSHGLRTYLAGTDLKINKKVSFDYSVSCSRNPVVTVGNELPSRVTKEDVRINLSIAGEDVGDAIGITGNYAALNINVFDTYGDSPLAVFGCTGQVFNQNLAISEGGYIDGTISVSQEYLTGRVFY
tara:strand:- start:1031 stop:1828 length:798 start_codon:yes stop_codon:yes gene_type:complete